MNIKIKGLVISGFIFIVLTLIFLGIMCYGIYVWHSGDITKTASEIDKGKLIAGITGGIALVLLIIAIVFLVIGSRKNK